MDLKEEIEELIRERYGSVPKLARVLNIPDQTIYSSLKGSFLGSSLTTALPILQALELDPAQLLNGRLESTVPGEPDSALVPLYPRIPADWQPVAAEAESTFPIPYALSQANPGAFLMRVNDEGMSRVLPLGSYALVRPLRHMAQPNMPYALCIGNRDALIRRVKRLENGYLLIPDSLDPTFHQRVLDFSGPSAPPVQFIGQVVWYTLPLDWGFPQP